MEKKLQKDRNFTGFLQIGGKSFSDSGGMPLPLALFLAFPLSSCCFMNHFLMLLDFDFDKKKKIVRHWKRERQTERNRETLT